MIKVCHITSVHPRYDTRVYHKELKSLANAGYEVVLITADGLGDEVTSAGIKIFDVGKPDSRKTRLLKTRRLVYKSALAQNAQVYHLHDPELLPFGVKLKRKGFSVIYDVHEDLPRQILSKHWINKPLRKILSVFSEMFENYYSKRVSCIVTATDFIRDRYLKIHKLVTTVKNYPIIGDVKLDPSVNYPRKEISYIGSISKVRGVTELIASLNLCKSDIRLNLAGNFAPEEYKLELEKLPGWEKVNYVGYADRQMVKTLLSKSFAGMVTLHPTINYIDALPVKLFEYMEAGVPVVSSDIPLWKSIVQENECGVWVNPLNSSEIAEKIDFLFNNPNIAMQMGIKGQEAVAVKYNWKNAERELLNVYSQVL